MLGRKSPSLPCNLYCGGQSSILMQTFCASLDQVLRSSRLVMAGGYRAWLITVLCTAQMGFPRKLGHWIVTCRRSGPLSISALPDSVRFVEERKGSRHSPVLCLFGLKINKFKLKKKTIIHKNIIFFCIGFFFLVDLYTYTIYFTIWWGGKLWLVGW